MKATIVILRPWMQPAITRVFSSEDAAELFLTMAGFDQLDPHNWMDETCTFGETIKVSTLTDEELRVQFKALCDQQDVSRWQRSVA